MDEVVQVPPAAVAASRDSGASRVRTNRCRHTLLVSTLLLCSSGGGDGSVCRPGLAPNTLAVLLSCESLAELVAVGGLVRVKAQFSLVKRERLEVAVRVFVRVRRVRKLSEEAFLCGPDLLGDGRGKLLALKR